MFSIRVTEVATLALPIFAVVTSLIACLALIHKCFEVDKIARDNRKIHNDNMTNYKVWEEQSKVERKFLPLYLEQIMEDLDKVDVGEAREKVEKLHKILVEIRK